MAEDSPRHAVLDQLCDIIFALGLSSCLTYVFCAGHRASPWLFALVLGPSASPHQFVNFSLPPRSLQIFCHFWSTSCCVNMTDGVCPVHGRFFETSSVVKSANLARHDYVLERPSGASCKRPWPRLHNAGAPHGAPPTIRFQREIYRAAAPILISQGPPQSCSESGLWEVAA